MPSDSDKFTTILAEAKSLQKAGKFTEAEYDKLVAASNKLDLGPYGTEALMVLASKEPWFDKS